MNLNGVVMTVSATASNGVVDSDTRLWFQQKGSRVHARYRGGSISNGRLIGELDGESRLTFRYAQVEADGQLHAGRSQCELIRLADGRLRIVEHFEWRTRAGNGVNVFDEVE